METKGLGVMLGGMAAVVGLAYARTMSGSLAEFSTRRGKLAERALNEFGDKANRHYRNYREMLDRFLVASNKPGGDFSTDFGDRAVVDKYESSMGPLQEAYKNLQDVLAGATPAEKAEIYQKLPDIAQRVPLGVSDMDTLARFWSGEYRR